METNGEQLAARRVADVVAERIEKLIGDGVLKVGQALPSERRLTEKLGVSRSALREGMRLLRARGVIDTQHGKGSFVASLAPQQYTMPMMHLLASQPRTLYDLFEVRGMLEAEAARLAARRGTEVDFILITRCYEDMTAPAALNLPPDERAKLDHAFHRAICEASHNPILVTMLQSLTDLLLSSVFASVNNLYHREPLKKQIDRQHARLYNAVTGRLPDQAHKAAREHIRHVIEGLRELENDEQRLVRATLRMEGWK